MEERRCPRCAEPLAADEEFCHNCGLEIAPIQVVSSKKSVSTGALWLAAILIIIGLVVAGTLTAYVAVSSLGAEKWETFFAGKPEPEPAASASNAVQLNGNTARGAQPKALSFSELPSTAPENDYVVLKKELVAQHNGDKIQFMCAVQNISEVVCTGVGVEVELYNAAENFVGSSSSWVYRDIQPGEVVELDFEAGNGGDARWYCLTKIGGKPVEMQPSTAPEETDTPDAVSESSVGKAASADGRPAEKEAAPAFPNSDVSLSDGLTLLDGSIEKVQRESTCRLEGYIRNDSGRKYDAVYIRFVIYDAENNQITTAITYTNDFEPGVVWKFSTAVLASYEQAVSYKISSVSVY